MKKRRKFAPEFKAKVALEALAGELTLAELAAKHDIHPNLIQQWRQHAKESMPDLFSGKATVGITAGASAPESLVDDVINALGRFGPVEVSTLGGVEEKVHFRVPRELVGA